MNTTKNPLKSGTFISNGIGAIFAAILALAGFFGASDTTKQRIVTFENTSAGVVANFGEAGAEAAASLPELKDKAALAQAGIEAGITQANKSYRIIYNEAMTLWDVVREQVWAPVSALALFLIGIWRRFAATSQIAW